MFFWGWMLWEDQHNNHKLNNTTSTMMNKTENFNCTSNFNKRRGLSKYLYNKNWEKSEIQESSFSLMDITFILTVIFILFVILLCELSEPSRTPVPPPPGKPPPLHPREPQSPGNPPWNGLPVFAGGSCSGQRLKMFIYLNMISSPNSQLTDV